VSKAAPDGYTVFSGPHLMHLIQRAQLCLVHVDHHWLMIAPPSLLRLCQLPAFP